MLFIMDDQTFNKNPRRQQELRMRPVADLIYKSLWGFDTTIQRIEQPANFILDKEFAIDVIITFNNGMILTGQEKFLSPQYASFQSLTIEYMNNPSDKGDWFHLASQFYFCGYASPNWLEFQYWAIINWPFIVLRTIHGDIKWYDNSNQNGHAKASFKYLKMPELPREAIIASSF